jgi:type II restriction/modification system DNA methylase subunit YeeA
MLCGGIMNAVEFVAKWQGVELKERSASHSHFIDLCGLLDEPTPTDVDPTGDTFCFEKGATKVGGGDGWADVWKRGHFGWEYKGKRKNLEEAHKQLQRYAPALENPPLLIVSDMDRFVIHTNWTNTVARAIEIRLEELVDPDKLKLLKWAFSEPARLRPTKTRKSLTEDAARAFVELATELRTAKHDPHEVAHFVNRLVFCMFAEDVDLLPDKMFSRLLKASLSAPENWQARAEEFFSKMSTGGWLGLERVPHFNGGLFDSAKALPLTKGQLLSVQKAADLDWADIDASIFGTLFERGLDPSKRSQLGAHYTDREKIDLIIGPTIIEPLLKEWEVHRAGIQGALAKRAAAKSQAARTKAWNEANGIYHSFLARLADFRVLDPACGSGNFLFVALVALKDIELMASIEAAQLGVQPDIVRPTGPENVLGIELNDYAAELARVTVWIAEIQWAWNHGFKVSENPVLRPLANIETRDAVLNADGTEAPWPPANVIIGNPPFLGDRQHRIELGDEYTEALRTAYSGRVPARADLVVYWLQKATEQVLSGATERFGLVATKAIAKGASRRPLDQLVAAGPLIFNAWTNEPWVVEGAAVRVSILCASSLGKLVGARKLNGDTVAAINPDLTSGSDVTRAKRLSQNRKVAFQGVKLTGPFDLRGAEARELLARPLNPNGRPNTDVLKRLYDIDDVLGRDSDRWVVDFGTDLTLQTAMFYEGPFGVVADRVVPFRSDPSLCRSDEARLKARYWEFQRPRPELRKAIHGLSRFIATPESSEHRLFVFVSAQVLIQGSLFAIARSDELMLGILSSRIHEVWSTAQGNRLGAGNQRRYNIGVTFETFPFPFGLGPEVPVDLANLNPKAGPIRAAAQELHGRREAWLNPPDLVEFVDEVVPAYPARQRPIDESAAAALKGRNLTRLYNEMPSWLQHLHKLLDEAVADAYGFSPTQTDEQILTALLELNAQMAAT